MNCCPLQLQNFQRWTDNTEKGALANILSSENIFHQFVKSGFHNILWFSLRFNCDYDFMSWWLTETVQLMSPFDKSSNLLENLTMRHLDSICNVSTGVLYFYLLLSALSIIRTWWYGNKMVICGNDTWASWDNPWSCLQQYRIDFHAAVCCPHRLYGWPYVVRMVCCVWRGIVVQSFASRGDKLIVCVHQLMTWGTKRLKASYHRSMSKYFSNVFVYLARRYWKVTNGKAKVNRWTISHTLNSNGIGI